MKYQHRPKPLLNSSFKPSSVVTLYPGSQLRMLSNKCRFLHASVKQISSMLAFPPLSNKFSMVVQVKMWSFAVRVRTCFCSFLVINNRPTELLVYKLSTIFTVGKCNIMFSVSPEIQICSMPIHDKSQHPNFW